MYILQHHKVFKSLYVGTIIMPRIVEAVAGGKISIRDNVEEIYEKIVTLHGNGAKIDSQKKYIGRRAYVIILKD